MFSAFPPPGGSGLPKIDENLTLESKPPKQRLVEVLDMLEGHVEKLRKEAIRLEEERDSLLASLDSVRTTEILAELADRKYFVNTTLLTVLISNQLNR